MLARRYCLAWPHLDVVTKPNVVILKTVAVYPKEEPGGPKRLFFVLSSVHQRSHRRPIAQSRIFLDPRGFSTRSTVDTQRTEQRRSRIIQPSLPPPLPLPRWANKLERARFRTPRVERVRTSFFFSFHSSVCNFPLSSPRPSRIFAHVLPFALASSFQSLSTPSSPLSLSFLPS
ncbi:hypothetical protein P5V15_003942 [Pogonomyrmex californicus]